MTSTKAEPGPYDGLEKARDDEPVFTLLGRDDCSPPTILHWVDLRRNAARKLRSPERMRAELIQCTEAEMVAWEMDRWRKKMPAEDTSTPKRATYSGVALNAAELDEIGRAEATAKAVEHLREAAFYFCEARDALIALGLLPATGVFTPRSTKATLNDINEMADEFAPKRAAA